MSGSGNDFILIDNREGIVDENHRHALIIGTCRRKMSAGADGLILVEESAQADFSWRFYNADGSRAEMCGNGARCVSRFAYLKGIAGPDLSFETDAGLVRAEVNDDRVTIHMTDPTDIERDKPIRVQAKKLTVDYLNTGVPHVVLQVGDIEDIDVVELGRTIRFHETFAPVGTNVNFVTTLNDGDIAVRTYERGVEDETLACGTGCVASALIFSEKNQWKPPINVRTRSGGILRISFSRADKGYERVLMEGDARIIYEGVLWEEAWK